MARFPAFRMLFMLLVSLTLRAQSVQFSNQNDAGFTGIKGQVFDLETGKALSANIIVRDSAGKVQATYYEHFDGFFTNEDGTFSIPLKPGSYSLKITHGIDYLTLKDSFLLKKGERVQISARLKPWVKLRERGWVNGDGHAHLYSEMKSNDTMLRQARKICLAQGVVFLSACQGWAGYNDSTWKPAYSKVSDERFNMFYGAEMPKYRTGHVWWLGLKSTLNNFGNLIDSTYETQYYQSEQHPDWDFSWLKFKSIPDLEVIQRYAKSQGAMAIMAHPTSFWDQKRGSISKYVSNVACNLSFGLLSGNIWNGMVAMGYSTDNYFYQNIWFHVLNEGYIMPPFSELDGGYPRDNKFHYGYLRTYFFTDPKQKQITPDEIVSAVKKGRTFVTSGPIVFADIDNQYQVGDIIPIGNRSKELHIEAYASGEQGDYLSYVVIFRNGTVFKYWDLRQQKLREIEKTIPIQEKENAWYMVKVYGRNAWADPKKLDVISYCNNAETSGTKTDFPNSKYDVAFTSPFYFRHSKESQPKPLVSSINLSIISPKTHKPIPNSHIDVFVAGEKINSFDLKTGQGKIEIPINALLKIIIGNNAVFTRTLYLDYPPYLKILERISNGNWLQEHNWKATLSKSHVPWSVFRFKETKAALKHIEWEITAEPNERDGLWEQFERLFVYKKN